MILFKFQRVPFPGPYHPSYILCKCGALKQFGGCWCAECKAREVAKMNEPKPHGSEEETIRSERNLGPARGSLPLHIAKRLHPKGIARNGRVIRSNKSIQ